MTQLLSPKKLRSKKEIRKKTTKSIPIKKSQFTTTTTMTKQEKSCKKKVPKQERLLRKKTKNLQRSAERRLNNGRINWIWY